MGSDQYSFGRQKSLKKVREVFENSAIARRGRFRTASVHKISPWGWQLSLFSPNLICFRNKAKNAGRFRKNAGKPEGKMRDLPHGCGMVDTCV